MFGVCWWNTITSTTSSRPYSFSSTDTTWVWKDRLYTTQLLQNQGTFESLPLWQAAILIHVPLEGKHRSQVSNKLPLECFLLTCYNPKPLLFILWSWVDFFLNIGLHQLYIMSNKQHIESCRCHWNLKQRKAEITKYQDDIDKLVGWSGKCRICYSICEM